MTGENLNSGNGAGEENELKWPESCMYYGGSEWSMGHLHHKCNHGSNKQSCMPISCPLTKLDKMQDELEEYQEKLKTNISSEEIKWYESEIGWLESKIQKIIDEVA